MLENKQLNLKGYLVIAAVIVLIVGVGVLVFVGATSNTSTTVPTTTGLPVAGQTTSTSGQHAQSVAQGSFAPAAGGQTQPTLTLVSRASGTIVTKDFLHNGETVADVVNPGTYVLAGSLGYCTASGVCGANVSTTDFSISYATSTQFFNIILLAEPVGLVRSAAERFFLARLGIGEQAACALNYYVGTPYWVNESYDNKNLGFSFCPGATALPH